jgi:tripartite-type tricarboxylate transporter receptor subunit TctC
MTRPEFVAADAAGPAPGVSADARNDTTANASPGAADPRAMRRALLGAAALAGTGAWSVMARAQPSPGSSRPVMLIGPVAAGGSNDGISRIFAQKLSAILGRPVLVDNKPGAAGLIAAQHVVRAAPDGSTLLIVSNTFVIAPHVYRDAGYDAVRDFAPVTPTYATDVTWVTRPDHPARSLADLVAAARANPGKLTYATNGVGSYAHLQVESFKARHGVDLTHVPFKSLPEGSTAVMGGTVDVAVDTPFGVLSRVRAGTLRALVLFGAQREESLPELPTHAEAGFPDPDQQPVFAGIVAPAKTPEPVLAELRRACAQVLKDPDYIARLRAVGSQPLALSSAEFGAMMERYGTRVRDLVAQLGITPG